MDLHIGKSSSQYRIRDMLPATHFSELLMSDSLENKFSKLNIEAELSVSILSGLVKVSGSGKFLDEKRSSAKKSTMSLIYNVEMRSEEITLSQLKEKINFDALETEDATHVLTGIDWGARCTVTAEYEFSDKEEKKEISGALQAEMNKIGGALSVSGSAKVEFGDGLKGKEEKFKFYSKCDVGSTETDLPVTFQEAVNQAKILPSLIAKTNDGKGVPLKFTLTPLESVKKWFQLESQINVIYKSINQETLKRIVQIAQRMTETSQKLNDLYEEITKGGKFCIPDQDIQEITSLVQDFAASEAGFREKLQNLLKQIRGGTQDISELDGLLQDLESGQFSPNEMNKEIRKRTGLLN